MSHALRMLPFVSAAIVLVLLATAVPTANAEGPGVGWVRLGFGSSPRVAGSYFEATYHRYVVNDNVHDVELVQKVELNTAPDDFGSIFVGLRNDEATSGREDPGGELQTDATVWTYVDLGGLTFSDWGGGCDISWRQHRTMISLYSAMKKDDGCDLNCQAQLQAIDWTLSVDAIVGACGADWTLSFPTGLGGGPLVGPAVYPVGVVEAKHGVYSNDTDDANDVHIATYNHRTFRAPQCPVAGVDCPRGNFTPEQGTLWSAPDLEASAGAGVRMWSSEPAQWRVCYGRCPRTPCGCFECPPPALGPSSNHGQADGNTRWQPDVPRPIFYYIRASTFSDANYSGDWEAAIEEAAGRWNAALGGEYLRRVGTFTAGEIVLEGAQLRKYGRYEPITETVEHFSGWHCDPTGPPSYRQIKKALVKISTAASVVEWTDEAIYTTRDMRPDSSAARRWIQLTIAHEFGHALGLDHAPLSCPQKPVQNTPGIPTPTPTPGPTRTPEPYPLMCSRKGRHWYNVPVEIEMQSNYLAAIECVFFDGGPDY